MLAPIEQRKKASGYDYAPLLDGPTLLLLPQLAARIGVKEAIVLQQLHYLLSNPKNGREIKGRRWLYNTMEEWVAGHFPFLTVHTLRRVFQRLEKAGYIATCQPEGIQSRRKYYSLNAEALPPLCTPESLPTSNHATCSPGMEANCATGMGANCPLPYTETTPEKTAESPSGRTAASEAPSQGPFRHEEAAAPSRRENMAPSRREAIEYAQREGLPTEAAATWWDDHDAKRARTTDPFTNTHGQPLLFWPSSLLAYARQWQENERARPGGSGSKGKTGGLFSRRETGGMFLTR